MQVVYDLTKAVAVQADQKEDATVETTAETGSDNKVDASDIEDLVSIKANDKEIGKDESVYLISDASGKVYNTIVSDHLTNKDKADTLEDQSNLKDIKNVKGDEEFTQDGDKLTWKAGGNDIYYQGTSDEEAPVSQKVTYYLDGNEIDPKDLAGKSGKVTIHFDYTNNSSYKETINGKEVEVKVPFAAVTAMVLDDSFTTIAYAIKEGRRVYRNIQKVIQFLLAGNIAEILTLFVATVLNWDAPLLAVHKLWVNLATATLPSLALGVDPASRDIMDHPPVKSGTLFEKDLISRVITQGVFVAAMTIAAYWIGADLSGHQTGQTMAFCVLAFSQMLRAFNQRSNTQPIWVRAEGHNPWLILSFAVSLILMMCLLLIPALQDIFRLTSLSALQWAAVLILSCLSILQMEIVKLFKR